MTKCAIYARVSTRDKGQDTRNQTFVLENWSEKLGYELYQTYVDEETGTGRKTRPAFEQMFDDARKRKFDVLLVWSFDRFSREGIYRTFEHMKRLADCGVKFRSYQESFLDTTGPMADLLLAIFAWVARQESLHHGERVRAGMARAVEQGSVVGRPKAKVALGILLKYYQLGFGWGLIADKYSEETGEFVSVSTVRRKIMEAQKEGQNGTR